MSTRISKAVAGLAAAITLLPAMASAQKADERQTPLQMLQSAPESQWITIDPENILVMDLPSGPLLIEMRPDLAPQHVERMRTLTRQGFYDGVTFHRVIDGFMAQGGDPTATGTGGSDLPNLAGEFAQEAANVVAKAIVGRDDRAAQLGFVGTVPVGTQAPTLAQFLTRDVYALWGLHCQGVMSMARAGDPNSANSQFFIMYGDKRDSLDQGYTVWGKVVDGYINAKRISRGEPPVRPTPIVRMRMMSDLPADEQTKVEYLDPSSEIFTKYLKATYRMGADGYIPDICSIDVPVRINGELSE